MAITRDNLQEDEILQYSHSLGNHCVEGVATFSVLPKAQAQQVREFEAFYDCRLVVDGDLKNINPSLCSLRQSQLGRGLDAKRSPSLSELAVARPPHCCLVWSAVACY